ncbi:DJ-1/PfpI family protein [Paenibacillus sp. MBLB4367]|uniref:DJ-1/PfpI family protein n=1 Tax=Paenibacillus sp. MBLB4367 TaxID=3384767 RepID=UPI0039082576
MRIAYILFDGMTSLDFIGFYDAVSWLKIMKAKEDLTWDLCADKAEITDDRGMTIKIGHVRPDLSGYDVVFVPGGIPTRQLRHDADFIAWLQTAAKAEYKVSVCTGALLLGAAGFLNGKQATTNPSAYDLLAPYCDTVLKTRIVRDGNVFTGGGVSASIDLGLFFVESLAGIDFVRKVQAAMDYPYYRPGRMTDLDMPFD